MALNFNVDPYYDDFDPAKNFHRILFKPGRAVQARELTQSQTILQDQITKFADNIFKQNSPVSGGQVTTNFNCYYIKLQETFNGSSVDASLWDGLLITNNIGTVTARVIKTVQATGGDPPTLIVTYKSGVRFGDNDLIYDVNSTKTVQAVVSNSTGYSSVASIAQGVFYVLGNFVQVNPATIVLEKYGNVVSKRIGLEITETIYDYANDASMLDPAVGASNYQAPGADRYVIKLDLTSRPIYFGDDQYFIELVRVEDGSIFKMVDGSVYNVIDDYFAKRDYETNGDYVVEDFKLTPKTNPNDTNTYLMSVGKGLAYVRGYRTLNPSPINITTNRARTIGTQNTETIFVDYGSYFYVSNVRGANASTFDITTSNTVDFHCVTTSNVNVTSATTYNSTLVATGYIRGLTYDHSITNSQANTYTYKAFVYDLQNNVLTGNVVSSTSTTVTLPSTASSVDGAYVGVNISITKGTDAGEQRTISSYVGSTKVATLTNSWGVNPDATSVFVLNFDTKDVESMMYASKSAYPATIYGTAAIDNTGKVNGLSSGDTIFENPTVPEMIYRIGNPYVSGVVNPSYTTSQEFRNVTFGVSGTTLTAQLSYAGDYSGVLTHIGNDGTLSSDVVKQSFTIIVTNKGTNTTINNGDIINWVTGSRVVTISGSGSVATFTTNTSDLTAFTATVIAKVSVINAGDTNHILKVKKLITANTQQIKLDGTQVNTYTFVDDTTNSTGQIYINAAGVVSPGTKQSIYLSDVKRIVKIIDTKSSGTPPILSMLTNSTYDVTSNFIFDNGQRDSYYDHASITLRPGAPKPAGNLLVLVDYYQHSGGDGYFSKMSYIDLSSSPEDYRQIPNYVSKNGVNYSLRDCLDFRPARLNAQTSFVYRYSNPGDSKVGVFLPVDLTTFTTTYSYYLARKDKLVLTKDSTLQIIEGSPSLSPIFPSTPDGSLVLAELTHNPYTGYLPTEAQTGFLGDLSIEKVQHRRYTMSDIAGLDTRINRVEYYTALNSLEQNANSLQISDAYGLNRFKNGIMVDDFSGFSASETGSSDFSANINRRTRKMTSSQNVFNFPLKALALAYNMNSPSSSAISGLNYKITTDGVVNYFSLPYTTKNLVSQKLASRTVNVNPFSVSSAKGVVSLSPNVDNWVDTTKSPSLLITDPDLQVFQANGGTNNVLSYGDWQAVTGTPVLTGQSQSQTSSVGQPVVNHGRFNGPSGNIPGFEATYVTTTVTSTYDMRGTERQNTILGPYNSINNTYSMDNGYITDVSILSWIRPQQIIVRADGMLTNTTLNAQFDNVDVKNYIRKSNSIELESVSGTFKEGDVIGYYSSGSFNPTGTVIGVHKYSGSTNVRLYVAGDGKPTTYNNGLTLQNAFFDVSGNYQNATATGSVTSTKHYGGLIKGVASNTVTLSQLASTTNNFYTGQTIYINAGSGIGQSATITGYVGSTRVATLSTTLSCSINDIYSIGTFVTDEQGRFYGIFTIPPGTFHTGQRVFRFDNAINGNIGSVTTYSEGTFFSEGLQVNKQKIDFGASPSGAKDTFTQTSDRSYSRSMDPTVEVFTDTYYTPLDPVAQTFIIDPNNFPNGAFLDSAKFFFASKPASDTAPIRLSIVGTLNGYPNGSTLDHSIVTLTPQQVNVSDSPQYLDSTAYTEFKFSTPVYIQPGVLYSFILKSNSNEYTLWTAANGDTALSSSVKNLPTDAIPSTITKISTAPYVGGLFISQNSQTWSVDQNQSLMFTIERCSFDTTQTPTVRMVIPKKLPQRTLVDSSIDYYSNANNFTDIVGVTTNSDILVDAFNVTTTDFIPTSTSINYNYDATLQSGTSAGQVNINPGKYGSTMIDHLYLNDNKGERILQANSTTSFSLYAQMSSNNDAVSPILSDAGTTAYAIQYNINNCELSNNLITLVSGGSGYNVACTSVTVSAPTGKNGVQAYAAANISGGIVQSVYLTSVGSGYIETPRITITDANTTPGTGATVTVTGETSSSGGPAATRYMTKKVVLDAGFDSGDLQVYMTAYRPVGTDINVYYKVLNRNDTQNFDQGYWQLMTKVNSSDSTYSQTRNDLYEFTFAPGSLSLGRDQGYISYQSTNGQTYTNFSQFALKIVLTTTDKTNVPTLSDMRCVALPANINTVA